MPPFTRGLIAGIILGMLIGMFIGVFVTQAMWGVGLFDGSPPLITPPTTSTPPESQPL